MSPMVELFSKQQRRLNSIGSLLDFAMQQA